VWHASGAEAAIQRGVFARCALDARPHAVPPQMLRVSVPSAPPLQCRESAYQARRRGCPPARSCASRCPSSSTSRSGACGTGGGPWWTRASATDIRHQFTAVRHRACLAQTWPQEADEQARPVLGPARRRREHRSISRRRPRSRCPPCRCGSTRPTIRSTGACRRRHLPRQTEDRHGCGVPRAGTRHARARSDATACLRGLSGRTSAPPWARHQMPARLRTSAPSRARDSSDERQALGWQSPWRQGSPQCVAAAPPIPGAKTRDGRPASACGTGAGRGGRFQGLWREVSRPMGVADRRCQPGAPPQCLGRGHGARPRHGRRRDGPPGDRGGHEMWG
jgi:hypothetical protein